jgi:crotonobetainyl-CoA:carnitine CoA-transferase CaiB-like acyl-CoA transferase
MIAGGVAGVLLADFGADVVKVEQPGLGDPLRQWTQEGRPFWWQVYGRNKRYVTLNLKSPEGLAILERLVPRFDVVIESFIPGTLERMGLGPDVLLGWNPRLIVVRVSGWGQTGPSSHRPGFGTLIEAASGFAAMNGEPDGAPIVPSFPLADMASALYAANAIMFAVYHRDHHGGGGEVIDVALFESLFSLLGPLPAEYAALGKVRGRTGSRSKNAGPRGCYLTKDGQWVAVSGSTPKMAERFLASYDLVDMLKDPRFATNEARVRHSAELDAAVAGAIQNRTLAENIRIIEENELTAVAVQTVADIEQDPHWQSRQLTIDVPSSEGPVRMHNVFPRFAQHPGTVEWAGGEIGQDNADVYGQELGIGAEELDRLKSAGVI